MTVQQNMRSDLCHVNVILTMFKMKNYGYYLHKTKQLAA